MQSILTLYTIGIRTQRRVEGSLAAVNSQSVDCRDQSGAARERRSASSAEKIRAWGSVEFEALAPTGTSTRIEVIRGPAGERLATGLGSIDGRSDKILPSPSRRRPASLVSPIGQPRSAHICRATTTRRAHNQRKNRGCPTRRRSMPAGPTAGVAGLARIQHQVTTTRRQDLALLAIDSRVSSRLLFIGVVT